MCGLPRVGCAAPGKTNEEEDGAGAEEEHADEIKLLELLPLALAVDVQLSVGWWVVEELVEDHGDAGEDDSQIVGPAPTSFGVLDKGAGDNRTED